MIAYMTFSRCPESQRPVGVPLSYPWVNQECEEEDATSLRGKGWVVVSNEDYSDYIANMADAISAWETAKTQLGIESVVSAAASLGQSLMITFAAENVLLGITYDGQTGVVLSKLADVQLAMQAGSLYEAINRIRAIPEEDYDAKYITAVRLLDFINKIETYLDMSLSESL